MATRKQKKKQSLETAKQKKIDKKVEQMLNPYNQAKNTTTVKAKYFGDEIDVAYEHYKNRIEFLNNNVEVKVDDKGNKIFFDIASKEEFMANFEGNDFYKSVYLDDKRDAGTIYADRISGYNQESTDRLHEVILKRSLNGDIGSQWKDNAYFYNHLKEAASLLHLWYSKEEIDNIYSPTEDLPDEV